MFTLWGMVLCCLCQLTHSKKAISPTNEGTEKCDTIQIVFYNVENLFDHLDDPKTLDDDFTSSGNHYWTKKRYDQKLNKIGQSILHTSGWQYPAIIGLCEVENRSVLLDFINTPLFKAHPYAIIHHDSEDRRGIDVAVIYDSSIVEALDYKFIPVGLNDGYKSREIVYLKTSLYEDTLHLFLNHWPSRYQGALRSESRRMLASQLVKDLCDSITAHDDNANIIIMGDFNDEPQNKSIQNLTECFTKEKPLNQLTNIMKDMHRDHGTIKYKGIWYLFDQFIVSNSLLTNDSGLCILGEPKIGGSNFLLEEDKKYLGKKPFRTYVGFKYNDGYSDHLPIVLKVEFKK
ncbi:MAG: endonuclease [Bacteroidetes bacterium]|nr:endonuclease [Bacteroidota bacterium]